MDWNILGNTTLFAGVTRQEAEEMLECLQAREKSYKKGEIIYQAGDFIDAMGVVMRGTVTIESHDIWGNTNILDYVSTGEVFAETYACVPNEPLMISVIASEDTGILFLNTGKMLQTCSPACGHHSRLLQNLLRITSRKNMNLSRKIFHTASKSIRGRVLSYLSYEAMKQEKRQFEIPFSRQQLADYLGVDRSALSNELSKMQKDGLLTFERNRFCLNTGNMLQ